MENSTSFTYFYPLILGPTGKWKFRLEGLGWTRMRTMFQFRVKPSPQSSLLKSCLASMEDGWFNYYEDEVWFQAYFPSNFGKSLSFSLSTKFKACCGFIILSKYFWRFWRFSYIASKISTKKLSMGVIYSPYLYFIPLCNRLCTNHWSISFPESLFPWSAVRKGRLCALQRPFHWIRLT